MSRISSFRTNGLVSDWVDKVPAIVEAFYPGQFGGTALAKILFGDVNPSGKLAYTMAKQREDYSDFGSYPIKRGTFKFAEVFNNDIVEYTDGIYVGYRHFDKKGIAPSFPFGHGLSYTSFRYGRVKVSSPKLSPNDKLTVTADITEKG